METDLNNSTRETLSCCADKHISRRQFMERAAALGVSVTAATALWTEKAQATPAKGGHLRVGTDGGATTDTMDPLQSIGTDHITQTIMLCYDTLTEITADGDIVPSLAEGWDTSSDGKTWTFKLRKGVEFHNGKTLTADDVVWSIRHHLSENNKYAEGKSLAESFETIKADGADTVVLVQKEINFDLPAHLTSFGVFIGPEGTTDWNSGNGTGPYTVENFEPGVSFKGRKFENFYRDDQGHFESVDLLNISDSSTRSNALRTGSVDVIGQPDTKTAQRLGEVDGISLLEAAGGQHFTTAMRTDTDPFTDNNIRMAVKFGIERQAIVDKVFGGFGYVGNDHPIGRNVPFFNKDLAQREYDPDKSRFYLKQAGLSSIDLTLAASDGAFSGSVDMAVLMKESMRESGINMTVDRRPGDGYWSDVWLKNPWCCVYWNGRPTADWNFSLGYVSTSGWNDTYFKNARFDELLLAARVERDQGKRRQMYYEMQEILHNEGGTTVIAFASYLHALSDKLGHDAVSGNRRMDDGRLARRWWFKA